VNIKKSIKCNYNLALQQTNSIYVLNIKPFEEQKLEVILKFPLLVNSTGGWLSGWQVSPVDIWFIVASAAHL